MTTGNLSCTTLTVSGAVTTGALTCSGLLTANAGAAIASGQTLTLTGATVAGAPTWSSSQAITLSTAAQPNVTSVGTLTAVNTSGAYTTTLTSGAWLKTLSATTGATWITQTNTGANAYVGIEGTAGGAILTGTSPYAMVLGQLANYPVQILSNNTLVASFSSTGLAVTGTLSATTGTFAPSGAANPIKIVNVTAGSYGGISLNANTTASTILGVFGGDAGDPKTLYLSAPATGGVSAFIGGVVIGAFTNTGLAVTGTLSATSYLGVNGAAAVAPTAGYGTPTGNSITANFPGATATLAQTTGTLAQLILDLKRAGIILN